MDTKSEASGHYQGEDGGIYFAYQNRFADIGGRIDARKFVPFIKGDERVLDFGCGGGWLLSKINCRGRTGVEVNENAHAVAEANGLRIHGNVAEVVERDFDVIISHHCLEHVPSPIDALRSLKELLASEGRLIIVLPIDDWRIQKDYTGSDINHHLYTWTPRLLANLLVEAGFTTLEIKVLTHAWFPGWHRAYGKIPNGLFDCFCWIWSFAMKSRQLLAIAKKN